ncbi:MAG: nucleotidyltransferase family protein [Roseovarius sp.]
MRDVPRSVMLYAAGFGTRMGSLTAQRPKPLIEVAGKPLIDHALDQVEEFEAKTTVINLHYKPQMLQAHLAGRDVAFSIEQPEILETGGGLRAALPLLGDGPHFTMNTDAVWRGPNPLMQLAKVWDADVMDALLLCIPLENAVGHTGSGDFILSETGQITRGPGLVYSGVQIIKTSMLHDIQDHSFSLNVLWDMMLQNSRLYGISYPGRWCDVGHPKGIVLAEAMLKDVDV